MKTSQISYTKFHWFDKSCLLSHLFTPGQLLFKVVLDHFVKLENKCLDTRV